MTVDELITALIALGKPNAQVLTGCEVTSVVAHPVFGVNVRGDGTDTIIIRSNDAKDVWYRYPDDD